MNEGATAWILVTVDALEDLATQLSSMCVTIRQIENGAAPDSVTTAERIAVTRMPDGPTN